MPRPRSAPRCAAIALLAAALSCGRSSSADRCREATRDKKWDEAVDACRRAVDGDDSPAAALLLATALDGHGDEDEALTRAEKLVGTPVDAGARQLAGGIRVRRDELDRAAALLEPAIDGHAAAGDHTQAARTAHLLAGTLLRRSKLAPALRAARRAVAEATAARDPMLRGRVLLGLAKVLTALGDERRARAALVEAGSLLAASPVDQAWVLLTHGLLLLDLEDAAGAATFLASARDLAAQSGVDTVAVAAALNLAYAERLRGDAAAAQRLVESLPAEARAQPTAAYVEGLIAADRGQTEAAERLLAAAAADPPTDDYARDIAHRRGLLAEARGDARAAEALYGDAIETIETIRAGTEEVELRPWILRHRRAPYQALFRLLAGQGRTTEALTAADRLSARTWRDTLAAAAAPRVDGPTAQENAPTVTPRPGPAPPTGDALLTRIGDREVLLFVEDEGALWRFHLARGEVASLTALTARRTDVAAWLAAPDDEALADRLGKDLLPPALAAGPDPLYIVTGEDLASLPFAALRRKGRALIEDRPLVRLPGLAALTCRDTAPPTGPAVVLGDPAGDLPAARREATRVAAALGVPAALGDRATARALLEARTASLLHVAAHAGVDERGGILLLADGRLSAAEILAHRIAPAVAVLAGCATSATSRPEGWGSLASSFLAAGSRTVVATLRPMTDDDAAALFDRFYRAGGATRPALALALAQRDLARSAKPHRWAPVAVWGAAGPSDCR